MKRLTIYEDRRWRGICAAAAGLGVTPRAVRRYLAGEKTAISREKSERIRIVRK